MLDRFLLVISHSTRQMSHNLVLEHYRERGKAEGHMGEVKDVLVPALSSRNRPRTRVRGRQSRSAAEGVDAFACNEVWVLLSLLAIQVIHHDGVRQWNGLGPASPAGEGSARRSPPDHLRLTNNAGPRQRRRRIPYHPLASIRTPGLGRLPPAAQRTPVTRPTSGHFDRLLETYSQTTPGRAIVVSQIAGAPNHGLDRAKQTHHTAIRPRSGTGAPFHGPARCITWEEQPKMRENGGTLDSASIQTRVLTNVILAIILLDVRQPLIIYFVHTDFFFHLREKVARTQPAAWI